MAQGGGAAATAHGVAVEAANTAVDAVQEVAAVGGAGDAAPAVAGSVAAAADLVEQGVVGSDSVVPDLVVTTSGGALDAVCIYANHLYVRYNSGDEVEECNHKSFIEHEANKIREKGKAAYYKWGKFRCPYCTTKPIPKDGLYEHLMSHARGVATSGNDVKIRAEHAALLKAMGPI
ncbi:hypothetical protein VPH35_062288 [Triticum aestivum]